MKVHTKIQHILFTDQKSLYKGYPFTSLWFNMACISVRFLPKVITESLMILISKRTLYIHCTALHFFSINIAPIFNILSQPYLLLNINKSDSFLDSRSLSNNNSGNAWPKCTGYWMNSLSVSNLLHLNQFWVVMSDVHMATTKEISQLSTFWLWIGPPISPSLTNNLKSIGNSNNKFINTFKTK